MVTSDGAEQIAKQLATRLNRAVALGNELDAEIVVWRSTKPLDVVVQIKADGMGWTVDVVKFHPKPPLDEWGIRFAEIANHFRSVLNTMLTRICIAEGNEPTKRLQFPIAREMKAWVGKGNGERDRLVGIPERVKRVVYAVQPFVMSRQHGKPALGDVLAVLAWTDNQSKHALELEGLFNPGPFYHQFVPIYADSNIDPTIAPVAYTYDLSMKVGSALVSADTRPNVVTSVDTKIDLTMDIGFIDELGGNTPYRLVLEEFRSKVNHIIAVILAAWMDDDFDVNELAGSTDFQAGAAFGRAAVNQLAGEEVWDKDFNRSEAGEKARRRTELFKNFEG